MGRRAGILDMAAALVAAPLLLVSGASHAQSFASLPQISAPASASGEARPIAGWTDFCRRQPSDCSVDASEAAVITLNARIWGILSAVNRDVNASIRSVTDEDHWGVADRWDIPTDGAGDCEDYQLLKRRLLVEEGLPRRALRMTVVIDEKGEGHAVLMVRTTRGDFILDNKTSAIRPWYDTGYIYVKRESQDRVGWVSLGGATSPTATANR